jgi:hypothetical protein
MIPHAKQGGARGGTSFCVAYFTVFFLSLFLNYFLQNVWEFCVIVIKFKEIKFFEATEWGDREIFVLCVRVFGHKPDLFTPTKCSPLLKHCVSLSTQLPHGKVSPNSLF